MGTRTVDTIGLLVFTECMGVSDSLLLYAWLPGSLSPTGHLSLDQTQGSCRWERVETPGSVGE